MAEMSFYVKQLRRSKSCIQYMTALDIVKTFPYTVMVVI